MSKTIWAILYTALPLLGFLAGPRAAVLGILVVVGLIINRIPAWGVLVAAAVWISISALALSA